MPVEQFLASLRFEQRWKLDRLGIEVIFLIENQHFFVRVGYQEISIMQ